MMASPMEVYTADRAALQAAKALRKAARGGKPVRRTSRSEPAPPTVMGGASTIGKGKRILENSSVSDNVALSEVQEEEEEEEEEEASAVEAVHEFGRLSHPLPLQQHTTQKQPSNVPSGDENALLASPAAGSGSGNSMNSSNEAAAGATAANVTVYFDDDTDQDSEGGEEEDEEEDAGGVVVGLRASSATDVMRVSQVVYEHQRYRPMSGWSARHLLASDPKQFQTEDGKLSSATFIGLVSEELECGWAWECQWFLDMSHMPTDADGWSYASQFKRFALHIRRKKGYGKSGFGRVARRRRWVRNKICSRITRSSLDRLQPYQTGVERPSITTTTTTTATTDKQARIHSPTLLALGHRMRVLEESFAAAEAEGVQVKQSEAIALRQLLERLESAVQKVTVRITRERTEGWRHLQQLEEELNVLQQQLNECKKKLYFPNCAMVAGGEGVLVGCNDLWLEEASGQFVCCASPSEELPQLMLSLSGSQAQAPASAAATATAAEEESKSGVTVRVYAESKSHTRTITVTVFGNAA